MTEAEKAAGMEAGRKEPRGWRTDRPAAHGYYLAVWELRGKWVVSELWFNPDSGDPGWWSSRGYLGGHSNPHNPIKVAAWREKPIYSPRVAPEEGARPGGFNPDDPPPKAEQFRELLRERDALKAEVERLRQMTAQMDTNLNFGGLYAQACEEVDALEVRLAAADRLALVVENLAPPADGTSERGLKAVHVALAAYRRLSQSEEPPTA